MYLSFILATIKIYYVTARISGATDGQQTLRVGNIFQPGKSY